jgi:hypothetical protein
MLFLVSVYRKHLPLPLSLLTPLISDSYRLFFQSPVSPFRSLSYIIIIFPSIDVISAYPLSNHVLVNNLYIFITGHDTTKKPRYRFDWCLRLTLKIISALLPIIASFGVANLIYVLKYAGLFGFMCFAFPVLLQLKSTYVCKQRFLLPPASDDSESLSPDSKYPGKSAEGESLPLEQRATDEGDRDGSGSSLISELKDFFLPINGGGKEVERAYMTPYSSILFSHPAFVLLVGVVGISVFMLAFLSLFLHPAIMTCKVLLEAFFL